MTVGPGSLPAYRIITPRLVVRCWEPTDAPLMKAAIDSSVEHLLPWMPWASAEPEELQKKIDLLRHFRGQFDLGVDFVYGIFDRDETAVIGGTGLHTRVGEGAREIGYWIRLEEIGKGYATEAARAVLSRAPGLDVVDEPGKNAYPLPLYTAEQDNCQVGRLRLDCAMDNGLCFWVSGDQLLKGAALNAVQIAEELLK